MHLCRVRSLLLLFTVAAAVFAAGCGEGRLSSPTAPSALSDSSPLGTDAPPESLASTADELVALGGGKGHGGNREDRGRSGRDTVAAEADDEEDEDDDNRGRRRSLSGFVTAVGADSITIRGILVKITATTLMRHGYRRLTLADIAVGDHAQAKGVMSPDGTSMTAREVKVEDTGRDDDEDDDEVEVKGTVAALSGTCPSLTFTIGTTTVTTSSATTFSGVACAALANGAKVEVEGTLTGSTLAASAVELD